MDKEQRWQHKIATTDISHGGNGGTTGDNCHLQLL